MNAPHPPAVFHAYHARRARLLDLISARGGGVAIQSTAPEVARNADSHYPYRFDSHFYYLTGFAEPEALLVLVARGQTKQSILFCRENDELREIWDGNRFGPDGARLHFGFDQAYPISALGDMLPLLLADAPAIYYPLAGGAQLTADVQGWLGRVRARGREGISAPTQAHDLHALVDEMRLFKDDFELTQMRRAAEISAGAHARAMQRCRVGWREYHLEAELLHEFRRHGAQSPAYGSIVAAGANACILHYPAGDALLADGDLCLIDAGCEFNGYAADITRTFPINGRFSGPQRAVYEIVLAAQEAALTVTRPGTAYEVIHDTATRVLVQGMIDLKLLQGSLDGALESGSYRQFYMHRTGHWLGLDVHDCGLYRTPNTQRSAPDKDDRPWRPLEPGMVLTVEPGMYLRPAANVPPAFHHIGVRIEDDVLITASGHEVLTAAAPKTVAEIEAQMRAK